MLATMLVTAFAAMPRRARVATLAAAAALACPAAATGQPSQTAVATAEVTIKPKQNPRGFPNVGKDSKGSTCVFAAVNGVKAPAGEHRYAGNLQQPGNCDMDIKRPDKDGQPQPNIMIKGGLGMSGLAKFPAVKTAGSKADKEADADNALDGGVDYWLTADVATTATTTPEPELLVLLGTGIAVLAVAARSRLRAPSTSCRSA